MLVDRITKETTDRPRVVVDMTEWLDVGETVSSIVSQSIVQGMSGWSEAPYPPPGSPAAYDPTPVHLSTVALDATKKQLIVFFDYGTPSLAYTAQFVLLGTSNRQITIEIGVQVSGVAPVAPPPPPPYVPPPLSPYAGDEINLMAYADPVVIGNGTDVSDLLNQALATGRNVYAPAGTYRISKQIIVGVAGNSNREQRLRGNGKSTYFLVEANFDRNATSIFLLQGAETNGPSLMDFQLLCAQPVNATNRADFVTLGIPGAGTGLLGIKYPPAVLWGAGCNRFRLERLRISNCWDGIHQVKNASTGGWWIRDIEMSCYNIGLKLSTTADFCHLHGWHHWYFGQTGANRNVMQDGQVICMQFGEGDDALPGVQSINVSEVLNFTGKIVINNPSGDLMFSDMMMDGNNAVFDHVQCYWTQINQMYTTCGGPGAPTSGLSQINMRGGVCFVKNIWAWAPIPVVNMLAGRLQMQGGSMQTTVAGSPIVNQTGGVLTIQDVEFRSGATPASAPFTNGLINSAGGNIIFQNNLFSTVPGAGNNVVGVGALNIVTDSVANAVSGNQWNGWGWYPPTGSPGVPVLGFYGFSSDRVATSGAFRDGMTLGENSHPFGINLNMKTTAGQQRYLLFMSDNVNLWAFGVENRSTQNINMLRYNDAGVLQPSPTTFYRDGTTQLCRTGLVVNWDVDYPNMQPLSSGWNAVRSESNSVSPVWQITAAGDGLFTAIVQRRSRGPYVDTGGPSAPTAVQTNDALGNYAARGYDGAAWSTHGTSIRTSAQSTWSTSEHSTILSFYTSDTLSEVLAMQISRKQNVLIGLDTSTETAGVRLQVGGSAKTSQGLSCFGVTPPAARPTVSGSRGGNAALAALLTAIAATGIITDGTTA